MPADDAIFDTVFRLFSTTDKDEFIAACVDRLSDPGREIPELGAGWFAGHFRWSIGDRIPCHSSDPILLTNPFVHRISAPAGSVPMPPAVGRCSVLSPNFGVCAKHHCGPDPELSADGCSCVPCDRIVSDHLGRFPAPMDRWHRPFLE
jgi:hypothetical protein